jgi:predicted Zn-dependent protease
MPRSTRGIRTAAVALATAAALGFAGPAAADSAERHRPADGQATLLVLPESLYVAQAARAVDAAGAARQAAEYLRVARTTGDARFLGRAGAVIRPWQDREPVPVAIDLLAAELAQQRHDFDDARQRLDRILMAQPRDVQSLLMRANIGLLTGDFDAARRDCLLVLQAGTTYGGTVCLASAMTGPGSLERARRLLAALDARGSVPVAMARWRLSTEADLALRAGDVRAAVASLERAHALDRTHEETRTRLAEALLALGDPARALALAGAPSSSLARLVVGLRAALAQGGPQAATWRGRVDAALEEIRRRGALSHDREEGLLALHTSGDVVSALAHARRNFARQKDTADLRLLVEAALAAGDRQALGAARAWLEASGFEDHVAATQLSRGAT